MPRHARAAIASRHAVEGSVPGGTGATTSVYRIDPLTDPRWPGLVERHPHASVYHTREWLGALKAVYGYDVLAFTTSGPGDDLANAIPFCEVCSWITGHRLVSLPFSDHCQPLATEAADLATIVRHVAATRTAHRHRYVELRPLREPLAPLAEHGFGGDVSYHVSRIDLSPDLDAIYQGLHHTSIRQPIRRAVREGLTYESGGSEPLLQHFHRLLVGTRRKHRIPPPPIAWFRAVLAALPGQARVRVAFKNGEATDGILTLRHRDTLVYKYACSDPRFRNLGGTMSLLWDAIREAKAEGVTEVDMGRSDRSNNGLITFKARWGAVGADLVYYRCPARTPASSRPPARAAVAQLVFARMPDALLAFTGRILYRHCA